MTEPDLAGHHYLEHGVGAETTAEVIDILQNGTVWKDWDMATLLRQGLPRILGAASRKNVPLKRIRLGQKRDTEKFELPEQVAEIFDVVEETDHVWPVRSLYPKFSFDLLYKGRTTLNLGRVVIGQLVQGNLKAHIDLVIARDRLKNHTESIVVMSTNSGISPPVQSISIH